MFDYNQAIGSIFYSFFPIYYFHFEIRCSARNETEWQTLNMPQISCNENSKQEFMCILNTLRSKKRNVCYLKFKKKMNEKKSHIKKKANRVHSRCVFLPKMVLRCRNRDAVSFLLSWIFDVNFLTSTCVFFINMMLTMAML